MVPAIRLFWQKPRNLQLSIRIGDSIYTFLFLINDRMLVFVIGILAVTLMVQTLRPQIAQQTNNFYQISGEELAPENFPEDAIGYAIAYFEESDQSAGLNQNIEEQFTVRKQLLITQALLKHKAARLDQLSDSQLLDLNHQISDLFKEIILAKIHLEPHVEAFLTDTLRIRILETALMEQTKYHVPASIKLAQAALETAYGKRVVDNNYFGIKDKSGESAPITTTEYYTAKELRHNRAKVISQKKFEVNGKTLYKCKVNDSFSTYQTAWESFRAHSKFLHRHKRYAPLFTKGKDYQAWAETIGSTKYGGVGYATSPIYGELLKKIIKRYRLDLLDF
ncbi:MAG: glucosaminidase domain-containing protein [Bacteroidota bacterium]